MNAKQILELDLHRKNRLVYLTTITISVLGLLVQIASQLDFIYYVVTCFGVLCSVTIGFCNRRKIYESFLPYVALGGLSVVAFGFIPDATTTGPLCIMYILLITMSIYMSRLLTIIGFFIGLIGHLILIHSIGIEIFGEWNQGLILMTYYTVCAIILYFKERVSQFLVADLHELQGQTEKLNTTLEAQSLELSAKNKELIRLNNVKDQLLANTSHELRTPLNGIIGLADSLIEGATGPLSEATKYNLRFIMKSGRRLSALVNDLLDFAKMKHKKLDVQLGPTDLCFIANLAIEQSKQEIGRKKIEIVNALSIDELPKVQADENRLQQIFINLLANAIKFSQQGTITVSADEVNGSTLAVHVRDQGIGIAEEHFEKIFLAFEQVDGSTERVYGGTGLGLAVTKELVELQGGQISLKSTLGQGTTFTFTLTIAR